MRQLLHELYSPLQRATLVSCDNVSAAYPSTNLVQHQRTKHVDIDLHFVRERVAAGDVRVLSVPTMLQFADIFTKGLPMSIPRLSVQSQHLYRLELRLSGGVRIVLGFGGFPYTFTLSLLCNGSGSTPSLLIYSPTLY
jgi:hypothetical protein